MKYFKHVAIAILISASPLAAMETISFPQLKQTLEKMAPENDLREILSHPLSGFHIGFVFQGLLTTSLVEAMKNYNYKNNGRINKIFNGFKVIALLGASAYVGINAPNAFRCGQIAGGLLIYEFYDFKLPL